MKLGIKDGKIHDICSKLINKRDNSIDDKDYLDLPMGDWVSYDSWDSINNISLKDSPNRNIIPQKTPEQIKIEELEAKNIDLEARIMALENK
ncbi:hypothetical protein LCGC14_0223820 [marine sediment metagenome]|uniref:Uncharacterized protein n=1 Tax=marine sediment metagenome TaxID=412755 RepID=A0A0F9UGM7_9ZZZZ